MAKIKVACFFLGHGVLTQSDQAAYVQPAAHLKIPTVPILIVFNVPCVRFP